MTTLDRASRTAVLTMPLSAVCLQDLPRVGGKAAHLGELIAAKLPVPSGFVVTTDACARFLQSDPRIVEWLKNLENCDARDPAALRAAADELRQRLSAIAVSPDVAKAVTTAVTAEPVGAWAVRSSATVEDQPEASFAGQHDSFLNVRGGDAVVAAVKRCWISLFTERAISYRVRKNIGVDGAQMAVIVQQLIDADAAGVMFTADPAGGNSHTIIVEAAFGLGEAVVQGKVTPDRVEVSRSRLEVTRRDTGVKQMRIVAANDGVREESLATEKASACVLDDETAARLARLGLEVERVLGGPLDIEWGVRDGELWLLQARAVTTRPGGRKPSFEDRQVWTNAGVGEVVPDVMTPMTWSFLGAITHDLLDPWFEVCGVELGFEQIYGLVAGRVYFNFNTVCAVGRCIPGLRKHRLEEFLGGHQDALVALNRIEITEADLPRVTLRRWRVAVSLPSILLRSLFYASQRGHAAVDKARRMNEELARIASRRLSDNELVGAVRTASSPDMLEPLGVIEAIVFTMAYYPILFGLSERWFGQEGRGIANRLLAGVGDMDDAAAGHDLWGLAELAAREPRLKEALLGERTFTAFAARLNGCRGSDAFLGRWKAFMDRRGHHTRGEIELFNARWSECPDFVLDMVRSYVQAVEAGHASPVARQDSLARERRALEQACVARLRNPAKRAIFRLVLSRAQNAGRIRENLKSEVVRWLALLRRFLLELGARLAARGRLANADDIFFLEFDELRSDSLWDPETDLRALVAPRRREHERNSKLTPPSVIVGRFDPDTHAPEAVDRGTKVFRGLGVSAGKVTGRARVILRSDANERVQPGEILVAPFTDPGWTPYFVGAAGIVNDMGGMLSHGSIIAREYGIPAVVNVGPATQIIRTGQWLEVDADRGVVTVLDATPNDERG
ncbi:MAG TPA: PEP/pyruvate-binding domain-containing protein [Verrucomicrobiae bacterium]|nr:PEP/pyruvate-binding domain-containing protein [Verrucomicrobiae bacterium]